MKKATHPSLQARLLTMVVGLVAVVWLGAAGVTWFDARHELDELLDGHLAQAAALLVVQQSRAEGDDDDDDDGVADAPVLHKYAPQVAFQVFHEARLSMRSASVQSSAMSEVSNGFSTVRLNDGFQWRVFATRGAERDVQVYVGERVASRNTILWAVLRGMLFPLVFALPVLALVLWWAVHRGLQPLRHLGQLLGQRQARALEPVKLADMPSEMLPMIEALNSLFLRIESMVAAEQRFTADAAHELRTPIAAIRAQAQVAQGAGDNVPQREHALAATVAGCDRATRLVDQLLTLARLEAAPEAVSAPASAMPGVDLGAVAQRVGADLAPLALARQQTLELEASAPCLVAGDEMLMGALVRNLLDNALRYSPAGARIRVVVGTQAGQAQLQVHDSGPAMLEEEIARLGQRFYRVVGSGQSGSGLGWSIVKRIAEVTGARIDIQRSAELGGLAVQVCWPALPFTPAAGKPGLVH